MINRLLAPSEQLSVKYFSIFPVFLEDIFKNVRYYSGGILYEMG